MTPAPGQRGAADLLAESLAGAAVVARRLGTWRQHVAPLTPATAQNMATVTDDHQVYVDAFYKAFETLQDILENRCFRAILLLEGEPVAEMSRRDCVNRLVKLGAVSDERAWVAVKGLRNALSHDYPLAFDRQAHVLNEAVARAPDLDRAKAAVTDYAWAKLGVRPADPAGG